MELSDAKQLAGKHLVVGMTGGIAAYKVCELVRRLQDEGATVQVVMTAGALQFVTATTMQALSGRTVETDQWKSAAANAMPHIELTRAADAIIVAPATADFLAKLAYGLADDLLTTLALARDPKRTRLLVAPAMNVEMWITLQHSAMSRRCVPMASLSWGLPVARKHVAKWGWAECWRPISFSKKSSDSFNPKYWPASGC